MTIVSCPVIHGNLEPEIAYLVTESELDQLLLLSKSVNTWKSIFFACIPIFCAALFAFHQNHSGTTYNDTQVIAVAMSTGALILGFVSLFQWVGKYSDRSKVEHTIKKRKPNSDIENNHFKKIRSTKSTFDLSTSYSKTNLS